MRNFCSELRKQSGSVLLEALVSVVIFSFGMLAMISMQSAAVRNTAEAKYRADASFLANQVIGQMWGVAPAALVDFSNVTEANSANCDSNAETDGSASTWQETVRDMLPGAEMARQKIFIAAENLVTVRVCWLDRSSVAGDYHNHVVTAQINKNQ